MSRCFAAGPSCGPATRTAARVAAELAERSERNGVKIHVESDGSLRVPGESVTDPVAYTCALAGAAERLGAELRTGWRVTGLGRTAAGLELEEAGGGLLARAWS